MSTEVVIYPTSYDSVRLSLFLFALYGIFTSLVGVLSPALLQKILGPALQLIESATGLPPFKVPTTPNEHMVNTFSFTFSMGIGWIYFIYSGPLWHRGGRVFVEGGLWTRLMYISVAFWFCLFTPYGSSLLFLVAVNDVISVFLTKWAIGKSWIELIRGGAETKVVSLPMNGLKL